MQLHHQDENQDTLDAVTDLQSDCWKLLNSDCGTYSFQEGAVYIMSNGIGTYDGVDL